MKKLLPKILELQVFCICTVLSACLFLVPFESNATYCNYVNLTSQSDIDNFPINHGCDSVGQLSISFSGNINFDSLSLINHVDQFTINFVTISDFTSLASMEILRLSIAYGQLPNGFLNFPATSVQELHLNVLPIIDLSGLESLESLTAFTVSNCDRLKNLNGLTNLSQLSVFEVNNCDSIVAINLPAVTDLDYLSIAYCLNWEGACDFQTLTRVDRLEFRTLPRIHHISGFPLVDSIGSIEFLSCDSLLSMSFPSLLTLHKFQVQTCSMYATIDGLGSVTSVDELFLNGVGAKNDSFVCAQAITHIGTGGLVYQNYYNDNAEYVIFPYLTSSKKINIYGLGLKYLFINTISDTVLDYWSVQMGGDSSEIEFLQVPKISSFGVLGISGNTSFDFIVNHIRSAGLMNISGTNLQEWPFVNLGWVDDLQVGNNPELSTCCLLYEQIADGKMRKYLITNNAPGCNSGRQLFENCGSPVNADSDGVLDDDDNCININNPSQSDSDGDGHGDVCDNCPAISNPGQADTNGNGVGNACENANYDVQFSVDNGDAAISSSSGLILKGVDDNCYRVLVADGELLTKLVPCP